MTNRLAHETSPYLLQHAHNPVDWYPWGPEALQRAKAEDRPILLSIGYSACHWCHVMERESFEDAPTAAIMNRFFVNIKVDREERPDIDEIYMKAVQAFSGGHGGWPMTVFLTPDGKPYFGGTYFPPEPRHGMPAFPQVLQHAHALYRTQKDKVEAVTRDLVAYIAASSRMPRPAEGALDWLGAVADAAEDEFDPKDAGFGGTPKFPPHGTLAALLAHARLTGSRKTLAMATQTLDAMAKGGMYDVAGGGFARYSVDGQWRIPHFEKMLYDNGQLIPLYLTAFQLTGKPHHARVARESLDYVLREMTHPEGGFCASQDADSEGEEGKFYVWTPAQLREVLGVMDGLRAAMLLEVTDEGSFEHGTSVLRLERPLEDHEPADRALLERALPLLRRERDQRVWPGRDDKVIVAWNAMMISAFAKGASVLDEPRYAEAAAKAARFLLSALVLAGADGQPRLQRTWKGGRAHLLGYADDHALLVNALVDVYEATFDRAFLREALALADRTLALFWDEEQGALLYTGADAEALIARSAHLVGGAEPSANEAAALAFTRLAQLCGREDLGRAADRILAAYGALLQRAPRAVGLAAVAGAWRMGPAQELGIIGLPGQPEVAALLAAARAAPYPFRALAVFEGGDVPTELPWLEGKVSLQGRPTAYLCQGFACQAPTTDPADLRRQLDEQSAPQPAAAPRRTVRVRAPELPADPAHWRNLAGGQPLTLERLQGNVVILDFWTYCCINCLHVLPELAAIEQEFAGQPVAVVGVHAAKFPAEQEAANVERALGRHAVRHPVVLDPRHELWERYAIRSWPTVVVLDPTGKIAWQQAGEVSRHALRAVVAGLLEEHAADLRAPAWRVPDAPAPLPHLAGPDFRFPGKIAIFPDAMAQMAQDADPFSPDARLYVSDTGHHRVLELRLRRGADGWPTADVARVFGDGQPGLDDGALPRFREPQGLARHGDALWVADTGNHCIRRIDLASGAVETVAGTGERGAGGGGAGEPRKLALRSPWDVVVAEGDGETALFIAMAGSHQIWVLLPSAGRMGPFVGTGREDHIDGPPEKAALAQPSALALAGNHLFFLDSETSSARVYQMERRQVGTLVGQGLFDFGDVDGPPDQALLQHPLGLALGERELYIADTFNNKIKRLELESGAVSTLAGGDPAALCEPGGLTRAGDYLLVADTNNHRLRAVHRGSGEIRDLPLSW